MVKCTRLKGSVRTLRLLFGVANSFSLLYLDATLLIYDRFTLGHGMGDAGRR